MQPLKFPMANATYNAPAGQTAEQCGDLPVFEGPDNYKATCWQLNQEELEFINRTGCVWFTFQANGVPPIMATAEAPQLGEEVEVLGHVECTPRLRVLRYLTLTLILVAVEEDEDNFRPYSHEIDGVKFTGLEYNRKGHTGLFRDNKYLIHEPGFEVLGRYGSGTKYDWLGYLYPLTSNHLLLKPRVKSNLIILPGR